MTLKKLIEKANDGYKDGVVLDVFELRQDGFDESKAGDGLAVFVVRELEDTYVAKDTDKEQIAEAVRVMRRAIAQLEGVVTELES